MEMVDAIIADNTLNKGGAADAIRIVATGSSGAEARAWIDAIAVEYGRLGIINEPGTYNKLRAEIIREGVTTAEELFTALATSINALDESVVINEDLRRVDLRDQRNEVTISIATMKGFKIGASDQVKDALDHGIAELRKERERVKTELKGLNEDSPPDPDD